MAYVFRLHQNADDTLQGWANSAPYGSNAINQILDPDGATTKSEITSIPSPFARIDLVKTAFDMVAGMTSNKFVGNTAFHKIVSDTLDIAEIFFNLNRLKNKVQVIVWNKSASLNGLINSASPEHKQLGQTLELYLNQDQGYNFPQMQNIYLLNYLNGPGELNIIGGTSPRTLFFTNANNLNYVDIQFGTDLVFDSNFRPLHLREDPSFIKYLYALRASNPNFGSLFREFDNYLAASFNLIPDVSLKSEISQFNNTTLAANFSKISLNGGAQFIDVIPGISLHEFVLNVESIEANSDFVLQSGSQQAPKPLVLPNQIHTLGLKLVNGQWAPEYKAPYCDEKPLAERTLPYECFKYPYLTADDFLQPYLIQTLFKINNKSFFDGNISGFDTDEACILPLKPLYFEYFSLEDLKKVYGDGRKALEIRKGINDGVTVTLRLPIKNGNYITFDRIYYASDEPHLRIADVVINEHSNKGSVITNFFGLAIFPNYRLQNKENHYRVSFMDADTYPYSYGNVYSLTFHQFYNNTNGTTQIDRKSEKKKKNDEPSSSNSLSVYKVTGNFDYIVINDGNGREGIVIPNFEIKNSGGNPFKFSIDFGTTNTHIEYSVNGADPKPFEIEDGDKQLMTLFDISLGEYSDKALQLVNKGLNVVDFMDKLFLPFFINKKIDRFFPQRTAVNHANNLNFSGLVEPLLEINIPFFYERNTNLAGYNIFTDLKWSQFQLDGKSKIQVENLFGELLFLARNKIVSSGGDIDNVEFIWFYPSSMSTNRIGIMDRIWKEYCGYYISQNVKIRYIPESIAPFYYFSKREGISAADKPVISIDIGGGTTDVVLFKNSDAYLFTSFKFAGNALFGDGFNSNPSFNGFVKKYKQLIKQKLEDINQITLLTVMKEIEEKNSSVELISFFFSLENNVSLNAVTRLSFSQLLQDDPFMKPVLLLFTSAIVYHMAELMKMANLDSPRYLTLSGTGSKIFNILDGSTTKSQINLLVSEIFAHVYKEPLQDIETKSDNKPKEITCKGGLFSDANTDKDINKIKRVFIGDRTTKLEVDLKYNEITDTHKAEVIQLLMDFLECFKTIDGKINYVDKFGLCKINHDNLQTIILNDAKEAINLGITIQQKDSDDQNSDVVETLFFYPLIKGLNKYAFELTT